MFNAIIIFDGCDNVQNVDLRRLSLKNMLFDISKMFGYCIFIFIFNIIIILLIFLVLAGNKYAHFLNTPNCFDIMFLQSVHPIDNTFCNMIDIHNVFI